MYSLNEKVVYPGQGVARINRILEKSVAGKQSIFFELKFLNKDMTILVPVDNIVSVGIRRLSTQESINHIFSILNEQVKKTNNFKELSSSSWNKRSKQYQFTLRSGNLVEISKIYRDLNYISIQKELSFGERNLLIQTETLLVQEISLVKNVTQQEAIEQLKSCFSFAKVNAQKTTQVQIV